MGVFKRPESKFWWLWLETAPKGQQRERTDVLLGAAAQQRETRKLAEQIYFKRMGELAAGNHELPGSRPTISLNKFADWFETHVLTQRRGAEREREILPRLRAAFGGLPLEHITRSRVQEWMTARLTTPTVVLKKKRVAPRIVRASAATVNREVDLLKAILQAAVPQYLKASPLYGMKRLRTLTPKRRLVGEDEEQRLLKVMEPDDKALYLLGLDSLVRLSDLLDVRREDDHEDRIWIRDPKAGGGFWVPVSMRTRKALKAIADDGTPYYFSRRRRAVTERDRRNGVRQMLERYCQLASVPYGRNHGGITFHWATRRTGATRMLTRKVDVGTVQKVGRWKTPDVVLGIYHELIDEQAKAAVEAVRPRRRHSRTAP